MDIDSSPENAQDYGDFSRKEFLDLIEGIESPGSFAAFGCFDPIYPDISIDGRSVRVPLRPRQTLDVIRLGPPSERIPGVFGTLIVCLPSAHKGGDLVLRHDGETKVFQTSKTCVLPSQCQPTMACWYSDIHHEVLPVTSGYRWVLTYNLATPPNLERPSANTAGLGPVREIRRRLVQWLHPRAAARTRPRRMYYRLSHDYTEAGKDLFKNTAKWEGEYTGFTGNEGAQATHWYQTAMVMLVPSAQPEIEAIIGEDGLSVEDARRLILTYLFPGANPAPRLSDHQAHALQELLESAYPEAAPLGGRTTRSVLKLFGKRIKGDVFAAVRSAFYESGLDFGQVAESLHHHFKLFSMEKRVEYLALLEPGQGEEELHPAIRDWINKQVSP
ncbi:hypothetical protein B0T18DRAFT_432408 [Schizothecium vesticola]|uniref:Prolyl 4-hydroxylase alpha subunit Fe(2+) 2OG dioxygenase domain-containing protein n=1 Tax=Schizothecium vesticola TaxID=314040 RepID=A0AA40K0B1_9PEZI|nr:hypothetical protein B0T18DRAFT_432408 [Schizothecium vesticola]